MNTTAKPIYSASTDFIADSIDVLRATPDAVLSQGLDWAGHRALEADVRALVQTGKVRHPRATVMPTLLFVDENGHGDGRLGQLIMELVPASGGGGELYPSHRMTGIVTDASWDRSLESAVLHAQNCEFRIPDAHDVRWAVQTIASEDDKSEGRPQLMALKPGDVLTGQSAGIAVYLGLFALSQFQTNPGPWYAGRVAETLLALAILPVPSPSTDQILLPLGPQEDRKRRAFETLPHEFSLQLIVPSVGRLVPVNGMIREVAVPTVDALAHFLRVATASSARPDNLPPFGNNKFIGDMEAISSLTIAIRGGGLHVIVGQGGVGKTATVLQATKFLWSDGVFHARIWIDLYHLKANHEIKEYICSTVVRVLGGVPLTSPDQLLDQVASYLGSKHCLILLEGSERVPAASLAPVLPILGGQTVVVMTRRSSDAVQLKGQRYDVDSMTRPAALELLMECAGRADHTELSGLAQCWDTIIDAASQLPLFITWAGLALQHATDDDILDFCQQLKTDPLVTLSADPDDRLTENAGRFLDRSLSRVLPTGEHPDLARIARMHFMWLYAFDREVGASQDFWHAGVTASYPGLTLEQSRAARRALLNLGLVQQLSDLVDGKSQVRFKPAHALAWEGAKRVWNCEDESARNCGLTSFVREASAYIKATLDGGTLAELGIESLILQAKQYRHWVAIAGDGIFVVQSVDDDFDRLSDPSVEILPWARHRMLWTQIAFKVLIEFGNHQLKQLCWEAVICDRERLHHAHPHNQSHASYLAKSIKELAIHLAEQRSFEAAKKLFARALEVNSALVAASEGDAVHNAMHFKEFSDLFMHAGDCMRDCGTEDNAEMCYLGSLSAIQTALNLVKPGTVPEWIIDHADCLGKLRNSKKLQAQLGSKEQIILAQLQQIEAILAETEGSSAANSLASCLRDLGTLRRKKGDFNGAREALSRAVSIAREFCESEKRGGVAANTLASCLAHLGDVEFDDGNVSVAFDLMEEGLAIRTARTLGREHDLPSLMRLRQDWVSLCDAYRSSGESEKAAAAGDQACEMARKMLTICPDDTKLMRRLIESLVDASNFCLGLDQSDKAVALSIEACGLADIVRAASPNNLESVHLWVDTHQALAFAWIQVRQFEEAREKLRLTVHDIEQANTIGHDIKSRSLLAGGLYFLAFSEHHLGNSKEAVILVRRSIELDNQTLAGQEPNAEFSTLTNLHTSNAFLAGVLEGLKSFAKALQVRQEVVLVGERQLIMRPSDQCLRKKIANDIGLLAKLCLRQGQSELGMRLIIRATELNPDMASFSEKPLDSLAELLRSKNDGVIFLFGNETENEEPERIEGE